MKGSETKIINFMEGTDKRFVIPVYQRKYDWKQDNCKQLYQDLKKIVSDGRESHFFGSIVSAVVPNGSKVEYHIIDGQQRLTTITLILLAIQNLVAQGKITPSDAKLNEQISQRFLISPWANDGDKIKLRPVKSDRQALAKLFETVDDYEVDSNLTINYQFFYSLIEQEQDISITDLYAAIGKLEIISITLDPCDNAQLIFESLNSTGLALTEGDKIRNYVLMGLPAQDQNQFYDSYWAKIEKCTANDVSGFIRDYLSIKTQITTKMDKVYLSFKNYSNENNLGMEALLQDLLRYARFFEKLLTCKSGLNDQKLDDCLYRLLRLETTVTRPFFMEVLRLNQDEKLSSKDVEQIFLIIENYLFRRNICEVPTGALNKIFLNLNKEIIRFNDNTDNYVAKLVYALEAKRESGRFPTNEEFTKALSEKQIYLMTGKYKAYLFERFENYGTVETKDVFTHLDNNVYTIEHIMPQHLTPSWNESLGDDAAVIHETWIHRLANLTLTGYNPNLSNNTFTEKRDAKEGGYANSGLKMNQKIATKSTWGLKELQERNDEMVERAKTIWEYPKSDFVPSQKEFDSCTLDDESYDLTGRAILKYSYLNTEHLVPVGSWTDMFESIIKNLHQKDKSVLTHLAFEAKENEELAAYVSNDEKQLRSSLQIDKNIYVEKNSSTGMKINLLRKLFALYDANPSDLVFYLRDIDATKPLLDADQKHELRKNYWEYALPLIIEKNIHLGTFYNCEPSTSSSRTGFFGIKGFNISCTVRKNDARIDLCISIPDSKKNKEAFDQIYSHKDEIEKDLNINLEWNSSDSRKTSSISYVLNDVSFVNKEDWPQIANFHAEWSFKILETIRQYIKDSNEIRMRDIAGFFREWVNKRNDATLNETKCNTKCTRFTTNEMTSIIRDTPDFPSGWDTANHFFYEIINETGKDAFIQLSICTNNSPDDLTAVYEKINKLYPSLGGRVWIIPFKTSNIIIDDVLSKDAIFARLDSCMNEIHTFESDLIEKMKM